ncbi:MAG TPA: hypothetical protein VLB49_06070 [Gemmatimonadales bacterium]|nr:hypothetical protein [Gemmatimonadales bacterium]
MLTSVRPVLRAIGVTVVPEATRLDEAGWAAIEDTVAAALASRPATLQRQVLLFLRVVEWLPLVRFGRRFTRLDPARRARVLKSLLDAPLLLVRRGMWGLRTLLLMGYYGRPEVRDEIGYRAHPGGWNARRRVS